MPDPLFSLFKQQAVDASYVLDQADLEIDLLGMFPHCARSPYRNQIICSPYIHVQLASGAKGICFFYEERDIASAFQFVGINAGSVIDKVGLEVQIALVDAIFQHINRDKNLHPHKVVEFQGRISEKALNRACYIASLVQAAKGDRVGIVGCVEPMIKLLVDAGSEIRIADIHSPYQAICGIQIERDAMPIVDWATKLIVTGSALWMQTMGQILNRASTRSIFTVVFAMTGHNIAPHYLNYGANIVVSEHFPFYWFANTISKLEVYEEV